MKVILLSNAIPKNTLQFLRFFEEASHAADIQTGRPALEVGDLVIVDSLPAHMEKRRMS